MFVDTHCHLDFEQFDLDRKEVIQRAKQEGIDYLINIGSSLWGSKRSLELAGEYDFIFATVGFHPHEADNFDEGIREDLYNLAKRSKVVAIGEIGLDYLKGYSSKENQNRTFISLIELAQELELPLVLHCRQAQSDIIEILRKKKAERVVMHCFSGDEKFLDTCLEMGFFVSFTCNITYKNAHSLREVLKRVPLERLMLETDAPFLPPQEFRGKRNEPAYLKFLAQDIARLKGLTLEEVGRVTTHNAKIFFNLK
ncbi:MAG: TatD family hydrolase [Candidatus Omnitrophica bacterium]|nr:TatD family hydrolase [Candidatus Omnitrophota bacterium]